MIGLVIGGLYGGFSPSIFLAFVTIAYRFFIGGTGALATVILVTVVFLLIISTIITTFIVLYLYEVFRETLLINQRVIKAEKMELISHLASSISHEVRNPLAVVRGFLQLMQEVDIPVNKRREFLKISIEEID